MLKKYNKLVRDNIPEIIEQDGKKVNFEYVNKAEHIELLNKKLEEELMEYKESKDIEELADLVEVIYGILNCKNISLEEFEQLRLEKARKRGSFKKGIKLLEVKD